MWGGRSNILSHVNGMRTSLLVALIVMMGQWWWGWVGVHWNRETACMLGMKRKDRHTDYDLLQMVTIYNDNG